MIPYTPGKPIMFGDELKRKMKVQRKRAADILAETLPVMPEQGVEILSVSTTKVKHHCDGRMRNTAMLTVRHLCCGATQEVRIRWLTERVLKGHNKCGECAKKHHAEKMAGYKARGYSHNREKRLEQMAEERLKQEAWALSVWKKPPSATGLWRGCK